MSESPAFGLATETSARALPLAFPLLDGVAFVALAADGGRVGDGVRGRGGGVLRGEEPPSDDMLSRAWLAACGKREVMGAPRRMAERDSMPSRAASNEWKEQC